MTRRMRSRYVADSEGFLIASLHPSGAAAHSLAVRSMAGNNRFFQLSSPYESRMIDIFI
jgi:hypothetical protein